MCTPGKYACAHELRRARWQRFLLFLLYVDLLSKPNIRRAAHRGNPGAAASQSGETSEKRTKIDVSVFVQRGLFAARPVVVFNLLTCLSWRRPALPRAEHFVAAAAENTQNEPHTNTVGRPVGRSVGRGRCEFRVGFVVGRDGAKGARSGAPAPSDRSLAPASALRPIVI